MHKVKNIGFQGHHRPTHITWAWIKNCALIRFIISLKYTKYVK